MKNVLVFLIIFPFTILSQNNPINFENSGFGSNWTWTVFENDDNPIYFNIFNDIGIVWDNKTTPVQSDESIRSSAGFGIKFYSFIGPIAFTWGFPIQDESYDIKRMFTFSLGNIN